MKKLLLRISVLSPQHSGLFILLSFLAFASPALAVRGLFISKTADCSDVKSPEGSTAAGVVTYCLPGLGANQNQLMYWNGSIWVKAISSTGSVDVQDESVSQGPATSLNFVGAGVTATQSGGTATITIPGGSGASTFLALNDTPDSYVGQAGKLAAVNSGETAVEFVDPYVSGPTAHDAVGTTTNPVLIGGYASAAAPADVSADGDAVRNWNLRNGAQVVGIQAGGDLIGGDATNGLKVQVTTAPTTAVTGPLTDTELRATPLPVSGTVTANAGTGTMAVSAAALPLPTGAATSALQGGGLPAALGAGGGLKVDGSGTALPVSGTFWQATQPVSGTFWQTTQPVSITSMPSTPVTGTFWQATQPVSMATNMPVGANSNAKINCTGNAFLNMTTATTTEIVALSGSTVIYVCGYSLVTNGGTATNVTFKQGAGTNCGTSTAAISSDVPLTAATNTVGIARGGGEGMIVKTTTGGRALCVTSSGAATLAVDISYAQF